MNTLEQLQENSIALSNNLNRLIDQHYAQRRERAIIAAMTGIVAAGGLFQIYCIINSLV